MLMLQYVTMAIHRANTFPFYLQNLMLKKIYVSDAFQRNPRQHQIFECLKIDANLKWNSLYKQQIFLSYSFTGKIEQNDRTKKKTILFSQIVQNVGIEIHFSGFGWLKMLKGEKSRSIGINRNLPIKRTY